MDQSLFYSIRQLLLHQPKSQRQFHNINLTPAVQQLEDRCMLSATVGGDTDHNHHSEGELEYHTDETNWIEFDSRGHKKHADHVTWDTDPTTDELITVKVAIHDHGNLTPDRLARLQDAVTEVNSAATNFGVLLNLEIVTDGSENIHLHEDLTSGCGGNALGCAEYAIFINHSGEFGDGHGNHVYAGEETSGGTAESTLLSGFDWYFGADPNMIGSNQYDYQTVATQELLHLVGIDHDSTVYDSDPEVADNTDHRSVMHGTLGQGIVRRFMSTHDQELLVHLYGPGQTTPVPDGGDGGGGKGPPPGKGKNKLGPEISGTHRPDNFQLTHTPNSSILGNSNGNTISETVRTIIFAKAANHTELIQLNNAATDIHNEFHSSANDEDLIDLNSQYHSEIDSIINELATNLFGIFSNDL
jgi:hypothetical protein